MIFLYSNHAPNKVLTDTTVENPEDTLIDIARRHNIGYEEIRMANPDVSLWVPGEGTEVVIPARYILPPAPREGVVVNLSELRLYYYPADKPGIVETYPVSVGREEFATPVGITRTTVKVPEGPCLSLFSFG